MTSHKPRRKLTSSSHQMIKTTDIHFFLAIARGHVMHLCLYVICVPTEHQGVHKNSFRNARAFQDRIGDRKCWFFRRGENRSTWRKTSWSRVEKQQHTQPTYDDGSGNRTRDILMGGERPRHCAIPAPLVVVFYQHRHAFETISVLITSASIIFNAPVQESLKVRYICSKSGLCTVHRRCTC